MTNPSVSFQIEKIIDVITVQGNIKNFKVQWAPTWVSSFNLVGCEKLVKEFLTERSSENEHGTNESNSLKKDLIISIRDDAPNIIKQSSQNINEDPHQEMVKNLEQDTDLPPDESECIYEDNFLHVLEASMDDIVEVPMSEEQLNPHEFIKLERDNSSIYESMSPVLKDKYFNGTSYQENECIQHNIQPPDGTSSVFGNSPNIFEASMVANECHFGERNSNQAHSMESGKDEDYAICQMVSSNSSKKYIANRSIERCVDTECIPKRENSFCRLPLQIDKDNLQKVGMESLETKRSESAGFMQSIDIKKLIVEGMYKCNACDMTFVNSNDFSEHKCFICSYCNKTFYKKSLFDKHKALHISNEQKDEMGIDNPDCKDFQQNNSKINISINTCKVCQKAFTTKSHLKRHMLTHTGQRDFQCDVCGKKFSRNDILNRHLMTHIAKNEINPPSLSSF